MPYDLVGIFVAAVVRCMDRLVTVTFTMRQDIQAIQLYLCCARLVEIHALGNS